MTNQWAIFDIDGTLANCKHRVHLAQAKQWDEFHSLAPKDQVIQPVARLMRRIAADHPVVLLTGRNERYRQLTLKWLRENSLSIWTTELLMRPDDDFTRDGEMKWKMLVDYFKSPVNVLDRVWFVVDDRDTVCEHLRNKGLTVFQPAAQGY